MPARRPSWPASRPTSYRRLAALALCGVLAATAAGVLYTQQTAAPVTAAGSLADRIAADYGKLPLGFEANRGQVDSRVQFLSRGDGYSLFLTRNEAVVSLSRGTPDSSAVVRMRLLGANPSPAIAASERLAGTTNYVTGSDPQAWAQGVQSYGRVRYDEAYPGIDLVYHGTQRQLEYDFVVAPHADPSAIALKISGGAEPVVDRNGDLVIRTRGGELRQQKPVVYQQVAGARRTVHGRYVLRGAGRVGFALGAYDHGKTLVIDPVLSYATYLGGTLADSPQGIAVDAAGNAYITGSTASTDFPLQGTPPVQSTKGAGATTDAFVTKLNADGSTLVYSTYLGGGAADVGRAIAVDATGAYVVGSTASTDFPTVSPKQPASGGTTDAFVAKLNASGSAPTYSTYLGGSLVDSATGVAVDGTGNAYVTGSTTSTNFPIATVLQPAKGAGATADAFVTKFNADGSDRVYSTYLGGALSDSASGIAVDSSGSAYVAGVTSSNNFPTENPGQAAIAGGSDAFVSKLNPAGSALTYSTYHGGTGADNADGIAVDASGNAIVAGDTDSTNFPTLIPRQGANAGGTDAFVTKLNAAGSAFIYSTYLGGGQSDGANAVAADAAGRATIVGSTSSVDFPLHDPLARREAHSDMLVAQINAAGTSTELSTPLGGNASESATAVTVDAAGAAYLAGSASFYAPADFPTISPTSPFQADNKGSTDALVAKISADNPAAPLVTNMESRNGPSSGGTTVEISGRGFAGATSVTFGGTPAATFTINSDTSITAISPPRPTGIVPVRVTSPAGSSPANPAAMFEYAEGSWSKTGPLNTARLVHTMTLLDNGNVLAAGGRAAGTLLPLTSSEVYSPKTGTWSPTASLADGRFGHSATLLAGPACQASPRPEYCGKVLVAGGFGAGGVPTANAQPSLTSAELYDPVSGTWSAAGSMATRRALHSSTPLKDGRVLVAGGRTCDAPPPAACDSTFRTNLAEIYDPATNTWSPTAPMAQPHHTNRAALLPDGKVLVGPGFPDNTVSMTTPELYDPATGTWSSCPPPAVPSADCPGALTNGRARGGGTLLPNGKVIVAGGFPGNDTAELYDVSTGSWSGTGRMRAFGRFNYYSALLPNGRYLVAGGNSASTSAEVFDPATGVWSSAGRMSVGHGTTSSNANTMDAVVLSSSVYDFASDPAVCGANCGKVLVTGNTEAKASELYTPVSEPVTTPAPPPPPPPPGAIITPPPPPLPPAARVSRVPANLVVRRARLRGRELQLLVRLSSLATGKLSVSFRAAGRTLRFSPAIRAGTVRLTARLPRTQSRPGTGLLTLSYAGNARVLAERVRLRAGRNGARLRLVSARIAGGELRVSGTIARPARGVVRVRLRYEASPGKLATASYGAPIRSGRWRLSRKLAAAAAKAGGQLRIEYAGSASRRIAGEQLTRRVAGSR